MFVVLALTQMLAVGTTTLVAHAAGRKDPDGARRVFNQAQGLSMLAGTLFLGVALALTPAYAAAFAADADTAALVRQFLWWFVPALAHAVPMVALAAALRGIGDFKPGMIVQSTYGRAEHGPGAGPDLRLGHRLRRWAWPAPPRPRSSRSLSAWSGCGAMSTGRDRICTSAAPR